MCLKSFCPLAAQSALTCWAMRNVILRRSQLTRMFFYMGTEDSTSHESLNTPTEGANKSQAAAVGAAFWGAVCGDEAAQGLHKVGPTPATDLGLDKGSEDGHQLLIFHVVSRAERDIQDVDRLLMDILARTPSSQT